MAKKAKLKQIKKVWVELIAPAMFNNSVVGELPLSEPQTAMARVVSINLMTLTKDMRNQNYSVNFRVVEVSGQKAITVFTGYEMNQASLKKMVRRGKSKITQSSVFKTADDRIIRLKTIMITRNMVNRSILTALRKANDQFLALEVSKMKFDELGYDVSMHKLQTIAKKTLDKLYPLKVYEYSSLGLETSQNASKYIKKASAVQEQPAEEEDYSEETEEQSETKSVAEPAAEEAANSAENAEEQSEETQ